VIGPEKNSDMMECMRVASPGARVGHAWLNLDEMKGITVVLVPGSGTAKGKFGFAVADVGSGGRASCSCVRPGMRMATTF
jgi:hypothetical protein